MVLSLIPTAKQQFLDGNGKPLAGGTVTFYLPGTTIFATTYQDPAGTIPNANPQPLDGNGEWPFWGSGTYDQLVQDSLGNVVIHASTSVLAVSSALAPILTASSITSAVQLLNLISGIVTPATATYNAGNIDLTRQPGNNPTGGDTLGTLFIFAMPSTQTGPFTLSIIADGLAAQPFNTPTGGAISGLAANQLCLVAWNGGNSSWALMSGASGSGASSQTKWQFTASGTWVAPPGVTSILESGCGAGGGGGSGGNGTSGGGGGGGGASVLKQALTVSAGGTYAITIGTAGTAGTSGAGGAGSATTIVSSSFTTLSALAGGLGGAQGTSPTVGATGGAAGGAGGSAGEMGFFASGNLSYGGTGGSTLFGSGAFSPLAGSGGASNPGSAPVGFGAGGSGGANGAGGAGAPGYLLLELP